MEEEDNNIKTYKHLYKKSNPKYLFWRRIVGFLLIIVPILYVSILILQKMYDDFSGLGLFFSITIVLLINLGIILNNYFSENKDEIIDLTFNFNENKIDLTYFNIFKGPKFFFISFNFNDFIVTERSYSARASLIKIIVINYNDQKFEFEEGNFGDRKFDEFRYEIRKYCSNKVEAGWLDKLIEWDFKWDR